MALIKRFSTRTNFHFSKYRFIAFGFTGLLTLLTLLLLVQRGLNYGVDFRGGLALEVRFAHAVATDELRARLSPLNIPDISLQQFGSPTDYLIIAPVAQETPQAASAIQAKLINQLGAGAELRRAEYVGARVGNDLKTKGTLAVLFALGGIMLYIWLRFEWQFGLCGVIALLHDCLTTLGLFALFRLEFNLTTVAAVLTIAGYSINDTVVIYDRIRENLRKYKSLSMFQVIDLSINETFSRTVLTVSTVLIVLLILYFFGGEAVSGFSIAMLWGLFIGTYSTIFVASPLLAYLNVRNTLAKSYAPTAA
ncbi:MAG: protein translocase subunit SecF [Holosporales bacterium]